MKIDFGDSICNHRIYATLVKFIMDKYAFDTLSELWQIPPSIKFHTAKHMIPNPQGVQVEGYFNKDNDLIEIAIIDDQDGQEYYWNVGMIGHELLHAAIFRITNSVWECVNLTHYNYNLQNSPFNDWVTFQARRDIIHKVKSSIPVPNIERLLSAKVGIYKAIADGTAPTGSNKYA